MQYYRLLRSMLKAHLSLRRWRTRCCHCRICFLTHPRNAWRKDLGCPFGCRKALRKSASNQRSATYYQTDEGKIKKRALNRQRSLVARPLPPPSPPPPASPQEPTPWPREIVAHVQQVVGAIEGRPFSFPEILALLTRILRQHRMARCRRRDQIVAWLNELPP